MGVPMLYGTCEGGPFHAKQMAHANPSYRVAIDKYSKKVAPVVQAGEEYLFGEYRWDGRAWIWQA